MKPFAPNARPRRSSTRGPVRRSLGEGGSAIISVLVLAAVTAVLVSGFLFRSSQEAKMATRSFFDSAALNLAEAGLEEGLFAANMSTFTSANGWTLASGSTTDYVKTLSSGFSFQQATGAIYVRVDAAGSLSPTVTATGVVTIPNQRPMLKQLRIGAAKRRLWSNGIVAKGTLTFSGNAAIDSYDSNLGVYNAVTNRSDQATVATTSTALDPVIIGSNASIYGYVATGGAAPDVGSGGRIYGATTPSGTLVDSTRIRADFSTNLPDASAPTGSAYGLAALGTSVSLPRVGDVPGANGRYLYTATSVSLSGHDAVTVTGPVDIVVSGSVSTAGNASITITGGSASMNLYAAGSVSMAGNGLTNNTNVPANACIWGTAPSSGAAQSISITGNGSFTGTVYAPNGDVNMSGNGASNGAVVAKTVTIGGNGQFHYDTRLGSLATSIDVSFHLTSWAELTAAPSSGNAFARDNRSPFAGLF